VLLVLPGGSSQPPAPDYPWSGTLAEYMDSFVAPWWPDAGIVAAWTEAAIAWHECPDPLLLVRNNADKGWRHREGDQRVVFTDNAPGIWILLRAKRWWRRPLQVGPISSSVGMCRYSRCVQPAILIVPGHTRDALCPLGTQTLFGRRGSNFVICLACAMSRHARLRSAHSETWHFSTTSYSRMGANIFTRFVTVGRRQRTPLTLERVRQFAVTHFMNWCAAYAPLRHVSRSDSSQPLALRCLLDLAVSFDSRSLAAPARSSRSRRDGQSR